VTALRVGFGESGLAAAMVSSVFVTLASDFSDFAFGSGFSLVVSAFASESFAALRSALGVVSSLPRLEPFFSLGRTLGSSA